MTCAVMDMKALPQETGFSEEGSHPLSPSDVGEEEYNRLTMLTDNNESTNYHVIEGNGLQKFTYQTW